MQINLSPPDAHGADSSSTGASAAPFATITDPIARLSHEVDVLKGQNAALSSQLFDLQESVSQLLKQQQSHFFQQRKEQEASEVRQGWAVQHAAMQHHTKRLEYTSAASRGEHNLLEHEIASHQQARRETGDRLYCPCFTAEDEKFPPWEITRLRREGALGEDGVDLGYHAASPKAMGISSCPGGSRCGLSSEGGCASGWQDGGIGETDLTDSRLNIHLSRSSQIGGRRTGLRAAS
jgi:hypothetical protein